MGRHAGSPCSIWHYHCMHPCSKLQCGTGQITLPCRFRLQYEPVSHPYQMLVFINLTLSPTGVESISVGRKHHCIHNVLYMFRHFVVNFRHKMWTSVCYFTVCQLCLPNEYFKVYALNVEHYLQTGVRKTWPCRNLVQQVTVFYLINQFGPLVRHRAPPMILIHILYSVMLKRLTTFLEFESLHYLSAMGFCCRKGAKKWRLAVSFVTYLFRTKFQSKV